MAAKDFKFEAVTIWHPSGASNVVPDYELPYWTSDTGGGWSLNPPGGLAAEAAANAQTQVKTSSGVMPVTQGSEFLERPVTPPGTPIKRNDQGRFSLVYVTSDPTPNDPSTGKSYWIFDSADRTYRPITSYQQLDNFITSRGGSGAQDAMKLAISLDPASIMDQSLGWDGVFLGIDYSPKEDGSLPFYDNPNQVSDAITRKYGSTSRNYTEEVANEQKIRQVFNAMAMNGNVSQEALNRIEDPTGTLLAKYVSAATYGGYGIGEIWQDLKIRELAAQDPSYVGKKAVSDTMKLTEFMNTSEYGEILKDPNLIKPIDSFSNGAYLMNTPLGRVDDSFFQELTPTFDWTDPANQEKIDDIQAAWFDLALAQSQAATEQQKNIADNDFKQFITNLNRQFGLRLSNNVKTAWGQLQELFGNMENAGLAGSGIEREAQDRILADLRRSDEQTRQDKLSDEDLQLRSYLLNYADEQQMSDIVSRMDEEDAAAGKDPSDYRSNKWGIKPSQETLDWFDPKALAERFPNLSSKEIELMRNQLLDSNGMLRSNLYRQAIGGEFETTRSKQTFQQQELMARSAEEAARKAQQFEPSLSSYKPPETLTSPDQKPAAQPTVTTTPGPSSNDTVNRMLAEAEARRKAGTLGQGAGVSAQSVTQPTYTPPANTINYTPPKQAASAPAQGSAPSGSQAASAPKPTDYVKIKYKTGGEQTVMQSDWDSYWKNQSGWSKA